MNYLNDINIGSITSFFVFDGFPIQNNDMYSYIIAGDGIYFRLKNDFGECLTKIKEMPYKNINIQNIKSNIIFDPSYMAPLSLLSEIIDIFKYVNDKIKWEIMVGLFYDKIKKKMILNIPKQKISSGLIEYEYDDKYLTDRYVKYLEVHSHHSMAPNFSSIDDQDEKNKDFCFYMVIGKLCDNTNIYNVQSNIRIWTGLKFLNMNIHDVFEYPEDEHKLSKTNSIQLDNIIEYSKEQHALKNQQDISFSERLYEYFAK